jgi:GTP-binding protein
MIIKTAEFVISNSTWEKCPSEKRVEYAFIGRSNVGKSSLINMLTNHKKLAKTSGKPGKTQLINHFLINSSWFLVDLPGYGYAKVSKTLRKGFSNLIKDYILRRPNLINLFVLIDSRLEPQKIDLEFIQWVGEKGVPFSIIFTKADKLGGGKLSQNIQIFKNKLSETWEELPQMFISSAESGQGKEEIISYIDEINKSLIDSDFIQ